MQPMQQVTRLRSVRLQQPSDSPTAAVAAGSGGGFGAALLDVRLAEEAARQQAEHLVEMAWQPETAVDAAVDAMPLWRRT
jgi:hypothetical protein